MNIRLLFFLFFFFFTDQGTPPLLEFIYLDTFIIRKSPKGGRMLFTGIHKVVEKTRTPSMNV